MKTAKKITIGTSIFFSLYSGVATNILLSLNEDIKEKDAVIADVKVKNASLSNRLDDLAKENKKNMDTAQEYRKSNEINRQKIVELEGKYNELTKNSKSKISSLEEANKALLKKVESYRDRKEYPSVKKHRISSRSNDKKFRTVSVVATAYTSSCKGCTGITRTGLDVTSKTKHNGNTIIAVDPSVIPLHSLVKIDTGDLTFYAIAEDTGGAIDGYRIDILVSTHGKAIEFGRKKADITILREGK